MIDIAIDMGSTNTTIFKQGSGIVLIEPSVVALHMTNKGNSVQEIGLEAKRMYGRTDEHTAIVSPIVEGAIKNIDMATAMLKFFLAKLSLNKAFSPRLRALLLIPCGLSDNEQRAFQKVAFGSGINKIRIIPNAIATDLGDDNFTGGAKGHISVNIGGGLTEIAVISDNVIINGYSLSIGGKAIDNAIKEHIEETYGLTISENLAEKVKNTIGSLYDNDRSQVEIVGYDSTSQENKTMCLTSSNIFIPIKEAVDKIVLTIRTLLKNCSADIKQDIKATGINLSGGVSNLTGLKDYLSKELNLPIITSEFNENTTILGGGKLLSNESALNNIIARN